MTIERASDSGMHDQRDLVELYLIHSLFFVDTAENGPFKGVLSQRLGKADPDSAADAHVFKTFEKILVEFEEQRRGWAAEPRASLHFDLEIEKKFELRAFLSFRISNEVSSNPRGTLAEFRLPLRGEWGCPRVCPLPTCRLA